jgi:uncharacterized repeat protein (TIGR02059 family)
VTTVSSPPPVYVSSIVNNATPSILEMTYSLALAGTIPAASSFTVTVNTVVRAVNSVSVSGAKVLLTLASPIVYGNAVKVGYTPPASNPLQTTDGGIATTLTAQSVLNYVKAVPGFVSAAIWQTTPAVLEMSYDFPLAVIVPATSAFSVLVNSVARVVTSVSISGTKVLLNLSSPVATGNTVTVSYTKPSINPIQISSGGQAASISGKPVTNNVGTSATRSAETGSYEETYEYSIIRNSSPSVIEMVFGSDLSVNKASPSDFTVEVNSVKRSVVSDSICGNRVLLNMAGPAMNGDEVTVSYTGASEGSLMTWNGMKIALSGIKPVLNEVTSLILIYPNPARSFLKIAFNQNETESQVIRILDLNGRSCIETRIERSMAEAGIPLNLKPGIYVVNVLSGSRLIHVQKLIIL